MPSQWFDEDVHVVRHYAPGMKLVTAPSEIRKRIGDHLGDRWRIHCAAACASIQEAFNAISMQVGKAVFLAICQSASACLGGGEAFITFPGEAMEDVVRQGVGQAEGHGIDAAGCPGHMGQVGAFTDFQPLTG